MGDIHVQVCYVTPHVQWLRNLTVPSGTVLQAAIEQSGVLKAEPDLNLSICRVGIYGKLKTPDTVLREHDRIEIYRPLIADPKDSRRRRAAKRQ